MQPEKIRFLKRLDIFSGLSEKEYGVIGRDSRLLNLRRRGCSLCRQFPPGSLFYHKGQHHTGANHTTPPAPCCSTTSSGGIPMRPSLFTVITTLLMCLFLGPLPLQSADYSSGVTAKILKKATTTGTGQKIVYPVTDNAEVTAMHVTIAPHAETGWHSHPVPVYAYVITGTLEIEFDNGKTVSFSAGDAIFEAHNTRHNGRNKGSDPVTLAAFYIGASEIPIVARHDCSREETCR